MANEYEIKSTRENIPKNVNFKTSARFLGEGVTPNSDNEKLEYFNEVVGEVMRQNKEIKSLVTKIELE